MEKNNDLINQFAVITDLLEKISCKTITKTIIIETEKEQFDKCFENLRKMYNYQVDNPEDTFTIRIGQVDIIFNTNNV